MFTTQGMLLLLLVLGYVLTRIGIIPPDGKKLLSALTVNVTLPASILHAFQMEFDAEIARSCVAITLVGLCIQLGGAVLAQLLYRRAPADRRPVLQYGTLVSNSGILGTVIAEGIFGSLGVLYASVYVIPQRIIMWTLGVSYFEGTSDKKAALRRVAMNPCVLAVAAGLVIMLAQLHLPAVVPAGTITKKEAARFLALTKNRAAFLCRFTERRTRSCRGPLPQRPRAGPRRTGRAGRRPRPAPDRGRSAS